MMPKKPPSNLSLPSETPRVTKQPPFCRGGPRLAGCFVFPGHCSQCACGEQTLLPISRTGEMGKR